MSENEVLSTVKGKCYKLPNKSAVLDMVLEHVPFEGHNRQIVTELFPK